MPNLAYNRSTRRERELVNEYRNRGWHACRSAGSHSPWDIWAYNPADEEVVLTQIKTKKGGNVIKDVVLSAKPGHVTTIWRTYEKKKRLKNAKARST